jgi:hypothetical protein
MKMHVLELATLVLDQEVDPIIEATEEEQLK